MTKIEMFEYYNYAKFKIRFSEALIKNGKAKELTRYDYWDNIIKDLEVKLGL